MENSTNQQRKNRPEKLKTRVVGVLHNRAQQNLKQYTNQPVRLVFERSNPHHNKAVKVVANGLSCLGYLPREIAEKVVENWDLERISYKVVWAKKVQKPGHDTIGMRLVLEPEVKSNGR